MSSDSQLLDDCLRFIAKCVSQGFDSGTESEELAEAKRLLARVPAEVGYQGWSNRETWSAYLHLTNDAATCQLASKLAAGELRDFVSKMPVAARLDIGSEWRIDWRQLADALAELAGGSADSE